MFYFYQILTAFNKLKIMPEVVLLLPNTDHLQQVKDYTRGCCTSTKYWPPSTSWRLCQRLYHFYQILITLNKLKIMSEVVLFLPNTDNLQQVEDYVLIYTTCVATTIHIAISVDIYLTVSTRLAINSSIVRNSFKFAFLRYPHDSLSIVMAFSHFRFWSVPLI